MSGGAADELRALLAEHKNSGVALYGSRDWLFAHGEAVVALIKAAQTACEAYPGSSSNRIVRPEMHNLAAAVSRLTEPQT